MVKYFTKFGIPIKANISNGKYLILSKMGKSILNEY